MTLYSVRYHIAGLRGLPRRVYSGAHTGEYGAAWHGLTVSAAVGGVILFVSALAFVSVVIATWTGGRRIEPVAFQFAMPLKPVEAPGIWDRFGLWTIVAIVMVLLAYAWPIYSLRGQTRYGSPPFQPFGKTQAEALYSAFKNAMRSAFSCGVRCRSNRVS